MIGMSRRHILAGSVGALAIALVAFLGPGLDRLVFALTIIGWVGYARFTRAEFLKLRQQDFVHAAVASGLPLPTVLFRHILPSTDAPIIVKATLDIGSATATSLRSQWPPPADVISLLNVVAKTENCHPHRCRVLRSMPRQEKDSDSGIRKQSPRVRVCVSRAGLPAVAGLHAGLESPSQAIRGGDYRVLWRLFR